MANILLTGGTGYIASHTAITLIEEGHCVTLVDNLSNSHQSVVTKIETIIKQPIRFIKGDIRNTKLLSKVIREFSIEVVMHFAGLKAVTESVEKPIEYYANNVHGTISLLEAMQEHGLNKLIFSSSATVYGTPNYLPCDEQHSTFPINPYGRTKLHIEEMLHDLTRSNETWGIVCLRYFNPIGAHPSGLIGDGPNGVPNNLMPYVARVASGQLSELSIFGNDYETKDGTGERDYIHIMDLAEGHRAGVDFLDKNKGWHAINLGSGKASSVLEVLSAFEVASGRNIARKFVGRRNGDLSVCFANIDKAKLMLGWTPKYSLQDMCNSSWSFQQKSLP